MLKKLIMLLLGIFLTSVGLVFIITYVNLFTIGYSFKEYLFFIIKRWECIFIIPGLLLIIFNLKKG